ncbi:putative membrane protein YuiD [Cocos nucifera]|uniref:Putative membrane protein YuiD n=1 Tax=Cocos nucifera TaxID=13894 RepID=A0A8K0IVY5_COCNU|nr:putative membrane protein YuiD [Cocos nucifera]
MEALSVKLFFRVSATHVPRNPKATPSHFNPSSTLHSKPSPPSISFIAPPRKSPPLKTLETPPNAHPIALFCLLLPIFHSFGDFLFSWVPKFRSWLKGGLLGDEGICGNDLRCCGGIGMMLMNTTAALSKARVSPFLSTLAGNPTFVSGLVAWAMAQTIKMLLNFFVERRWDFGMLFSSGGMPSSHSALCMALTASVGLCHGAADSLFPVCLGFSLIVMYDAIGVRRHAGMQAEVLNKIIEDLFQGHPISERKLKELLGHTPSQVIAGALLGILVACVCCQGYAITV